MNKPQVENKLRELGGGGSCLHTGVPGWAVRGGSPVTAAAWAGQKERLSVGLPDGGGGRKKAASNIIY